MSLLDANLPITSLLHEICTALDAAGVGAAAGCGQDNAGGDSVAGWRGERSSCWIAPDRRTRGCAVHGATDGEAVGHRVGYCIRFESQVSAAMRIEVVAEDILTWLIQPDPKLTDIGAVLALDVRPELWTDLRLLVMSVTLDGERIIARWLDAPRISSSGRSFPVRVEYPPARAQERLEHQLYATHYSSSLYGRLQGAG